MRCMIVYGPWGLRGRPIPCWIELLLQKHYPTICLEEITLA
jgi:hypothetical protein